MIGLLSRKYGKYQTTGRLTICDGDDMVFSCYTLEPQYNNNEIGNSCIMQGEYNVEIVNSPQYGKCFEIKDVYNRTHILIHWGNYRSNTEGCVLLGDKFADINNDGLKDVVNSKNTFNKFMSKVKEPFNLIIR